MRKILFIITLLFYSYGYAETYLINFSNPLTLKSYLENKYEGLALTANDSNISVECGIDMLKKIKDEIEFFDSEGIKSYKYYIAAADLNNIVNIIQTRYPESKINYNTDIKSLTVEAKAYELLDIFKLIENNDAHYFGKYQIKYADVNQVA